MTATHPSHCSCCTCGGRNPVNHSITPFNRRDFLLSVGALAVGGLALPALSGAATAVAVSSSLRPPRFRQPLKVQPVLTYDVPKPREATSWRGWGGIQTDEAAAQEAAHIEAELAKIRKTAGFQFDIQPVEMIKRVEAARATAQRDHDVMLIYAAGGGHNLLEALSVPGKRNLMFLRHNPGPVYLWYEIVHPRFLRKTVDDYGPTGWDVTDVVVDSQSELLGRFRAFYGLKNTLGKRIVAIGDAGGWGAGGRQAPGIARSLWKMDLVNFPYADLAPRLQAARANVNLVKDSEAAARKYLSRSGVSLHTQKEFVNNAFVLREVLNDIMDEAKTDAITIHHCMGTIMGMSQTTACLPLSLLNDDGYLAFCESDFVVIPSGVLLHYVSGLPVFLNDPTYPHDNVVTLAHCTAPRKMDGKKLEKAKMLTHFESDYGAAPKVEMKIGQECTNLVPDFASKRWVGFHGTIIGNPFLDICRSQIDVRINGDCAALLQEMKGFHWMMSYGNYLGEVGYALKKVGVEFNNVSAARPVV